MSSPLRGIRVLELGQFIAGPYAGLQLADLGARVIKVERPHGGDAFREFGLSANAQGYSHNFCAFNRNKLSLALDVTSPPGQEAFRRMARQADVVHHLVLQLIGSDAARHQRLGPDRAARGGDAHILGVLHAEFFGVLRIALRMGDERSKRRPVVSGSLN